MQRASILSNEKYRGIRMLVDKGQLKLLSNNSEQEQAEEEMEISYNGPAIDIDILKFFSYPTKYL